ncbi:cytochrome c oxidase subunit 2 [Pullulanibacillus pueri]|uniref:EfeO-type cupredoxin-like domain-containing protein n=1 Tax=Pullulanibacillus pueri TaxID=1437324 RepID=A0A8J3EM27_9BACL|nr:cupredoxin domain-containing protein [Pullulanibacillus pueri]MBM7682281.1 cytochrome c oxidase subunit 2 [Pullulanibacillus pueri]GGH80962.1 hypothetical protein GCM10007096_18150 [Pullulanibacillus pueri]
MGKKFVCFISIVGLLILGVAACGNSEGSVSSKQSDSVAADGNSLTITATNFQFNSQTYKVPAGKELTIHFKSKEGHHGIKIEGTNIDIKGEGSAKVTFKPGTYKISCNVFCGSGHAKMQSKIVAE